MGPAWPSAAFLVIACVTLINNYYYYYYYILASCTKSLNPIFIYRRIQIMYWYSGKKESPETIFVQCTYNNLYASHVIKEGKSSVDYGRPTTSQKKGQVSIDSHA